MNSQDIWQIEVNERIYDASFEEVVEWINEGAILPEDKIKRGNLRWIRAGKVPELYEYFYAANLHENSSNSAFNSNAESAEVYTNFQVENFSQSAKRTDLSVQVSVNHNLPKTDHIADSANEVSAAKNSSFEIIACSVHTNLEPVYICEICNVLFCKTCPNSFGSSVKLCLDCGGLCVPYTGQIRNADRVHGSVNKPYKRTEKIETSEQKESSLKITDLFNALKYPFSFPFSFFTGASLLILLSFGVCLAVFGGKMFISAAIFGLIIVMLAFCVLAKIVENFSQKKFKHNFLPKLNKYNLWEDIIHPSFLSIAVYLISFGLFFAATFGAGFYTWHKYSSELENVESQMRQTDSRIKTSIKNAQSNVETENQVLPLSNGENNTTNRLDLEQMIKKTKEGNFESVFGTNYLGDNQEIKKFIKSFVRISIPFQMPMLFAFIFGLFYLPAAGSIAGSTRSFGKTVNPLLALKTIKSFGLDYFKILALSLIFVSVSLSVAVGLYLLFSNFNLKLVGIFAAILVGSILAFYFWTVFSYFLGMAVYNDSKSNISE